MSTALPTRTRGPPRPPAPSPPAPSPPRPHPRLRSASQARQIQVHNRRREYLVRHAEYLASAEHEFSHPLLYDILVRRHLSAAEREAYGKERGYARALEGHLVRSEAKLASLREADANADKDEDAEGGSLIPTSSERAWSAEQWALDNDIDLQSISASTSASVLPKDRALHLWHDFLRTRFVHGHDTDFDYAQVDADEALDDLARQDAEDAWFDDEEPGFVSDGDDDGRATDADRRRRGETGIQDF
ncbi:hypothetical protein BROUX41_003597 [Berkeleyomyces rouxiae]|uniref:uncharacterized protein n=1 Tax=Berkeleyomyces rouxiae TaxID=2035830 RepID=UPI003B7DCD0D